VDRVHRAPETVAQNVGENRAADLLFRSRRADDGHGARVEENANAAGIGLHLAAGASFDEALRGAGWERDVEDAGLERLFDLEAARREQLQHPVVLAEDVGLEPRDPVRSGDGSKVLQEERPDAAALEGVGDDESDLRAIAFAAGRIERSVAADADDLLLAIPTHRGHEGDVSLEVEIRETIQVLVAELCRRAEEAKIG
jgi:hypothetical protein